MPYPTTIPPDAADQHVVDLSGQPCARLTSSAEIARRLARLDEAYIRANFVPLDDLASARPGGARAVRGEIAGARLPQPAYRLDDGTDMVPEDYFWPLDQAGVVGALGDWFRARYARAARARGVAGDAAAGESAWQEYLGGGYFVCLRHATPENIAHKAALITALDRLLERPQPHEPAWRRALRDSVEELAGIERAGAILDPQRWGGPMSPQWYGAYLRSRYPTAFAQPDAAPSAEPAPEGVRSTYAQDR